MLRLIPDVENRACIDWEILEAFIYDRKVTSEAVLSFVVHLSHKKHLLQNEWLFAVPLVHFLCQRSQPFEEKIQWNVKDNIIGWDGIRSRTYDSTIG